MGFFKGIRRVLGQTGSVLRKVGEFGASAIRKYHQPASMMLHAAGELTGNKTLKNVAAYGLLASAAATGAGFGTDYGAHSRPLPKYT